ncbi:glycosyltransferase [Rubrivirga sp. S365]|uniref:Glycosyltransferase n=1 Tax=Rubrivirga litoralis TaxID=3075598 RepID=A0ABU3BQD6_9BACT|nr:MULTISPECIES: glycosyltransferase [unclassified Rubrivirga]MDT0631498.1 glycosyltransferase [Rubrivirga sp. F394]MDT7855519.1 glycosyltransferase [Rubrivirga sp. S365]
MPLSVLTLVRDRTAYLHGLLAALAAAPDPPAEVVVAVCGGDDPRPGAPATPFPVRFLDVDSGERIAYSPARNACARAAGSERLLFLDADCVPLPGALAAFDRALAAEDALAIGEVLYLPPGVDVDPADVGALRRAGRPHPARPVPPAEGWERSDRYGLAWGLAVAVRKTTFLALGGFDEGYGGYAGEDTDFAEAARRAGVPLVVVGGAAVAHRHHDVFEPPVQQLTATVANAQRFRDKWGWWPMGGWLAGFAQLGLVEWTEDAERAVVLREPTPAEVEAARRTSARPFRT